jgi:hypothetical protein
MRQKFRTHVIARVYTPSKEERLLETLTEYLAYVAFITIAVGIAILTMAFAANITVRWLDQVVKPRYIATETQPAEPTSALKPQWRTSISPSRFAMLSQQGRN